MNIQVSGANIKDDMATLSSIGVHTNAVIVLNGDIADANDVKQTASGNPEEYGLMVRIAKIVEVLSDGTSEEIEKYEQEVEKYSKGHRYTDSEYKTIEDRGNYLSERLMQCLIKLDSVECPFDFETARQRRREGVRLSQKLLERIDKARLDFRRLKQSTLKIK
ncbi:hypothetical protein BDB01DRAFT_841232 [Pilobolus umbonatus]|nr:hypothetical protein BDB01DRAFT_841232 [Pilobolus umbonatus]